MTETKMTYEAEEHRCEEVGHEWVESPQTVWFYNVGRYVGAKGMGAPMTHYLCAWCPEQKIEQSGPAQEVTVAEG